MINDDFHKNPFTRDRLKVHAIHASTSRNNFFINFIEDNAISDGFLLSTLWNDQGLLELVTYSETNWNPPFINIKILLLIETKIKEEISYEERKKLLNEKVESFVFGTINFKTNIFRIVVNNKDEEVILEKIKE